MHVLVCMFLCIALQRPFAFLQKESKLSPELSDVVVYTRSVAFKGFDKSAKKPPNEMSSFSESDAVKLIKESGTIY